MSNQAFIHIKITPMLFGFAADREVFTLRAIDARKASALDFIGLIV